MLLLFILIFVGPPLVYANLNLVNSVLLGSIFAGALLAGFLVEARTHSADMSNAAAVAVVTGLFCYMLNFLLSLVLLPRLFSDYVVLTAFVAGATAGMFLKRVRMNRQSLSSKKRLGKLS
jgi:hypothetical protein